MVRKFLPGVLTALAVGLLPQFVAAAETEKRPQRPVPQFFQRLDANHDGQVGLDEIPDGAPDRLKEMVKKADRNGDKRVSAEEFAGAMKAAHEAMGDRPSGAADARSWSPGPSGPGDFMRRFGGGRPGASNSRPGWSGRPGPPGVMGGPSHRGGPPSAGTFRHGGPPPAARGPHGRGGPSQAGPPRSSFPDPKVVFARLDKDKDQKLSLEEFAAGMKRVHQAVAQRGRPSARGPMGPHGPGPMSMRGRGPMGMHGPGPMWMRGRGPMGMHGRGPTPPHAAGLMGPFGAEIFKRADANKDGKISVKEVPESRRELFKKLLEKADKDGDQALSGEEARKFRAAVGERLGEFQKAFREKISERLRAQKAGAKQPEHKQPEHKQPEHRGHEHEKPESEKE